MFYSSAEIFKTCMNERQDQPANNEFKHSPGTRVYSEKVARLQREQLKKLAMPITKLDGEDRSFGGNLLYIEPSPRCLFGAIIKTKIHPHTLLQLESFVFKRVDYKCECCGQQCAIPKAASSAIDDASVNEYGNSCGHKYNSFNRGPVLPDIMLHDRWHYDTTTKTQRLARLMAVCDACHSVIYSKNISAPNIAHLCKIRQFSESYAIDHFNSAIEIWRERSRGRWKYNVVLLTMNDIDVIPSRITEC